MRRSLVTATVSMLVLLATAAPALAGAREEAGTRGSFLGVALALILGGIFAGAIVWLAYGDARFGEDEAHTEQHAEDSSIDRDQSRDESSGDQQVADETQAQRP